MSDIDEENDEQEQESEEEQEQESGEELLVTVSEAARVLGMSRTSALKLVKRGVLKYAEGKLVSMKHVNELKASRAFGTKTGDTQIYEAHTELTQVALTHVKDMFRPVTDAWTKAAEVSQRVIDSLISRNEKLEATHLDLIKQREAYLNDTHAREIAKAESEASQRRLDDIFNTVKGAAPDLLAQLGETLGGKKRATMATLVAKLAASGKLQVLLDSPHFLEDDERELLKEALKDFLPRGEVETTGETADTTDQTQSQSDQSP